MTSEQTQIIQNTWAAVSEPDNETAGGLFYNNLFAIQPALRSLFKSPVPEQSKKLMAMLHYLIHNLNKPQEITAGLTHLAQRHVQYNVRPEHYDIVDSALIFTLEQGLGELWNEEVKQAWIALYTTVVSIMVAAGDVRKAAA